MMKYLYQAIAYGVFIAFVALLSVWPSWRLLATDEALLSISFSHAAERIGECRRLTQEEMNELPPNMRRPDECPRERHPVRLTLHVDDELLFEETLPPSGLWSDGKANVYQRIRIVAGEHRLRIAMNDSGRDDGFDYERTETLAISPGQNLVLSFDEAGETFRIGGEPR